MLNIKLKKKPIGSVCSLTQCTFFEYVYLNHIHKIFNPLWVSQLKCHIYSKNIVGILRTTESIKSFSKMSISSAVRHQNLYFTFIFVQLQSIISRVFFLLLWQMILAIYMFRTGNPYQINTWKWVDLFLSWRLISNWKKIVPLELCFKKQNIEYKCF